MKERWGKLGFILASIGSAVGLGNIWRFPYIVGQNGGGSFIFVYLITVLIFGIPVMLLEIGTGKYFRASILSIFKNIRERIKWLAIFPLMTGFFILGYYLVVTGWSLAYFVFYLFREFIQFDAFTASKLPWFFFTLSLISSAVVVKAGIKKGIEKFCRYTVPFLFILVIILLAKALTLPNALEGIKFYLKPDFIKVINPKTWIYACGQALFSLSAGYGILMTYGSYISKKEDVYKSTLLVAGADTLIALLGSLLIFSIVFSFGTNPEEGPKLAFITLPKIFDIMNYGWLFGIAFFMLLFFAAITSAISIFELIVRNAEDELKISRTKSTTLSTIGLFIVGTLVVFNIFPLESMDFIFGTLFISLSAALICIIIGWFWQPQLLMRQVEKQQRLDYKNLTFRNALDFVGDFIKYSLMIYLVKFVIPVILIVLFFAELFGI